MNCAPGRLSLPPGSSTIHPTMTLLAVSIAAPDTDSALAALQRAADGADLAELRLDLMHEFDLPRLLQTSPLPLVVTCRPPREGGRWQGSEEDRLDVLRAAADLGAAYVDLEWDARAQLASLNRQRSRVIVSRHDFTRMPAALSGQAEVLWTAGADVVKLVGYANWLADVVPVLELLRNAPGPTVAIAMGACGLATRLLAFCYPGALLSFAALDDTANRTAPGQISIATMNDVYRVRSITTSTKIIGWLAEDANDAPAVVTGNDWLAARGLDARLIPLQNAAEEETGATLARLAQLLPLAGCLMPVAAGLHRWTPSAPQWSLAPPEIASALAELLAVQLEPIHGT